MEELKELPGFFLCKKGGRPPKTTRNIAIWIARHYRTIAFGELVKTADAFILEHWISEKGVSETAHIRAIIRTVKPLLARHFVMTCKSFVVVLKHPVQEGSTGWLWLPAEKEARKIIAGEFVGSFDYFNQQAMALMKKIPVSNKLKHIAMVSIASKNRG